MSRLYGMNIEISGFDPEKKNAIMETANEDWPNFSDDWFDSGKVTTNQAPTLSSYGEDDLCGGESEEEFTERISRAIWKANGGFCRVVIRATYLEDLPCEHHELDEDDYDRIMGVNTA